VDELRPSTRSCQAANSSPILAQFDVTRDLRGTFYCLEDWKKKYDELRVLLEDRFGVDFRNNGNSFESCFQFEGHLKPDNLKVRIKYYNKLLAFL